MFITKIYKYSVKIRKSAFQLLKNKSLIAHKVHKQLCPKRYLCSQYMDNYDVNCKTLKMK